MIFSVFLVTCLRFNRLFADKVTYINDNRTDERDIVFGDLFDEKRLLKYVHIHVHCVCMCVYTYVYIHVRVCVHACRYYRRKCYAIPSSILPTYIVCYPCSMPAILVVTLLLAVAFWLHRFYQAARRFLQFWEIRTFYHHALNVTTVSMPNDHYISLYCVIKCTNVRV